MKKSLIKKTALMYASDLLSRQDQSEFRLKQKLLMKNYPADEVEDTISKLKQHNYLNDERACNNQFELMFKSKRYSVRQIQFKLMQLGFDDSLIQSCTPDDFSTHDFEVAIKFLQSKFKTLTDDKKMWSYLNTKGFDHSTIFNSINNFKELIKCQS